MGYPNSNAGYQDSQLDDGASGGGRTILLAILLAMFVAVAVLVLIAGAALVFGVSRLGNWPDDNDADVSSLQVVEQSPAESANDPITEQQDATNTDTGDTSSDAHIIEASVTSDDETSFRERYATDAGTHPLAKDEGAIVVAVKAVRNNMYSDAIRGRLVELASDKGRKPISTAFKPAFYADGKFDAVWQGDRQILQQVGWLDSGPKDFLLARVDFSEAESTQFQDFVTVRGTVSILLLSDTGARGPWIVTMAGTGTDRATATANCAERLSQAIDSDKIFSD